MGLASEGTGKGLLEKRLEILNEREQSRLTYGEQVCVGSVLSESFWRPIRTSPEAKLSVSVPRARDCHTNSARVRDSIETAPSGAFELAFSVGDSSPLLRGPQGTVLALCLIARVVTHIKG